MRLSCCHPCIFDLMASWSLGTFGKIFTSVIYVSDLQYMSVRGFDFCTCRKVGLVYVVVTIYQIDIEHTIYPIHWLIKNLYTFKFHN